MKLYDFPFAPNAKKVRVYLAEKGIELPVQVLDLRKGEHKSPEFTSKYPRGIVPVLELDDGRCFGESLAIIEYLEELHPEPPMLGATPEARLRTRELERMCEIGVGLHTIRYVHHTHPFFASRFTQEPTVAENALGLARQGLQTLDRAMGDHAFVAGETPTVADCTLYAMLFFAENLERAHDLSPYANVSRWWDAFSKRPSAGA